MARSKIEPKMKEKQWPKGQSGNPSGKPKGVVSLKTLLRAYLIQKAEGKKDTYQELYIKRLLTKAISAGDMKAITLIWETFEGKPTQQTDITSGGKPLNPFTHEQLAGIARAYQSSAPNEPGTSPKLPGSDE